MSFLEQMKMWGMLLIIVFVLLFSVAIVEAFGVFVKLSPEIDTAKYGIVADWKEYFEYVPEVSKLIDEATNDNKILELEYNTIKEEVDKVRLKKYKKELGMEYEVSN